jgi:hypothetical protein
MTTALEAASGGLARVTDYVFYDVDYNGDVHRLLCAKYI